MLKCLALGLVLTLLSFVDATAAQLTVSWVDNSGGVASFSLERRAASSSTYSVVATVPRGVTSWVDLSVVSGSSYCYRVRAMTATSTSGYSNEACNKSGTVLTVSKAGSGSGTVVSSPSGIDCGSACSAMFPAGTLITLSATPATGSTFSGWSGSGCSGTAPCSIATNISSTVTATFTQVTSPPPSSSATLTLTYKGRLRDRVGAGNTARTADGALDGTLAVQVNGTTGIVSAVQMSSNSGAMWDTSSATAYWLLGVAITLDGALLNNATTMGVSFTIANGGTFFIFGSNSGNTTPFVSGRTLTVTTTFSNGTKLTGSVRIP
jgi:hypothetical protein